MRIFSYEYVRSLIERLIRGPQKLVSGRLPIPRLNLNRKGSMVYFGDHLLPIKGKEFDILCTLAEHPMQIVLHNELYTLIESKHYKDLLLRQYICNIRKAFPPPYCDPHHPQCIIVSRRMEGYYLNLPKDNIKIEPA